MPVYGRKYWNKVFSHVYVEKDAFAYPLTNRVLAKLPNASIIPVPHYKDIFNRTGQDYAAQKHSLKLLLAVRRGRFLLPGAAVCDHFGHERFFYATQMMNCPYDCEYCYLRGLYDSAFIVAFVNTEDYFQAVREALPAYVSISYDTDLLALEKLFHFVSVWIDFAAQHPSLLLELRTKSAGYDAIAPYNPPANVILSWTVSPDEDAKRYEVGAPGLAIRLENIRQAVDAGWKVRLCMDPVLLTEGWEERLALTARQIRETIPIKKLYDISIGGFRVSKTHYKRMRRLWPGSFIFSLPLVETNGVMAYREDDKTRIEHILLERLSK